MTKWESFKQRAAWAAVAAGYVVCWPFYQLYKQLKPRDQDHKEGKDS
ncbi:hypothetical protein LG302_00800 [Halomonas organivorans]